MGRRARARSEHTAYVEEYEHAYLVRGTIDIQAARLALFDHLGRKKWTRIVRMPYRPMWTGEINDKKPMPAVALYFAIGRGAERKYKP